MRSPVNFPPKYDSVLVFELLTDAHYMQHQGFRQGSYTIKDENGNIIHQRDSLNPSTLYRDTIHFASGCYEFRFIDDAKNYNYPADSTDYNFGDGMTNWPDQTNTVGRMWIKRATTGAIVKSFGMDFGRELFQQFTVGYLLDAPEPVYESAISIYPNPSAGIFYLDIVFANAQDVSILVTDMMGRKIYSERLSNVFAKSFTFNLSNQPNGIYFAVVQSKDKRLVRKLIKNK